MGGFYKFLVYPHMNPSLSPAELHQLLLKWQSGQLDAHATQRLEQWRAASPEHEREWQQLVALWQIVPPNLPQNTPLATQWANLTARIDTEEAANLSPAESPATRARRWLDALMPQPRWAFASLALLLLFAALHFVAGNREAAWQTAHARFGERVQLSLPDGSRVELNAGSTLRYPKIFSPTARRVDLHGEAFFQVQRAQTPFEITTPHAQVRVLGTSFNVRTWEQATTVFVQSGSVAVQAKNDAMPHEVLLTAGESAQCDTLRAPLRLESARDALAWRAGKLVFQQQPLAAVLRELQRRFDVRVQAEPRLLSHTVTASFANEPLTLVLEAIAAAIDARYESTPEGYWLREEKYESR